MQCDNVNVCFGAVISKDLASKRSRCREGCMSIGEHGGNHIVISLTEGNIKISFEQVLWLVVHPSERWVALLFEGVSLPQDLWSPEDTLIIELASRPQPCDWLVRVEASLPVLRAAFEVCELPQIRFPSDFGSHFLLQALQYDCHHRLTQACLDRLLALGPDQRLACVAALARQAEADPLTDLEPLEAKVSSTLERDDSLALGLPGLHLVRQCEVHAFGVRPQLPRLMQGSRLMEMIVEHGLLDYILMVTFVDITRDRISKQEEPVVKRAFEDGLDICGRRYRFLAASSDQLRHGGAYFFCEENIPGLGVQDLRSQVGDFSEIDNVSKRLARLGLALSTSTWVADFADCVDVVDDICIGGHCFTDGCGEMSQEVADEVRQCLGLPAAPSAVQIRLGGAKGVLVLSLRLQGRRVRLRKSMVKFKSDDAGLWVVSVAAAGPLTLNHDVLTLLGPHVPRQVWHNLLQAALLELARSLYEVDRDLDDKGSLVGRFDLAFAPVAGPSLRPSAGANPLNDPFMLQVLRGCYLSAILDLCERMHIPVQNGVLLVGVADPTDSLQPAEVFISCKGQIIEGAVIVYRNPASHPGDIRKVQAVNVPNLAYLEDVIVFSVRAEGVGAQPQFAKCSGGDLDGDLYAVLFDIEPTEDLPPQDGRAPTDPLSKPLLLEEVDIKDMVEYGAVDAAASEAEGFLRVALNDALGQASNAHKAIADKSALGPYSNDCLRLAALVSLAVDSPKTGDVVTLDPSLRAHEYPDWMLNPRKPTYASSKTLGELFRSVRDLHSIRCIWQSQCHEDYASSAYVQSEPDANLTEKCRGLFSAYQERVQLALVGWQFKSEVEMLVGPLRRSFSRRQLQRQRNIVVKTRFILGRICEDFAGRFDAILATLWPLSIEALVAAWWAADAEGSSAFRWIPWRRHGRTLQVALKPLARTHCVKSFPLVRLGEAVERHSNSSCGVEGVLKAFLQVELSKLIEAASTARVDGTAIAESGLIQESEVVAHCIEPLIKKLREHCDSLASNHILTHRNTEDPVEDFEGSSMQELGRSLVLAVSALPSCAAAVAPDMLSTLSEVCGQHQAERVTAHVRRLLGCHAHKLCISLDLSSLFSPVELHDHILALTLKQLAAIRVNGSFVKYMQEKSGARISIRECHSRKKDGRPAIWSLQLRGTFVQLLIVERELERLQCAPPPAGRAWMEHAASAIVMSVPVDRDARVDFESQPAAWMINPAHARRGARPFQFEVPSVSRSAGTWQGDDGGLKEALEKALGMIEPFQEAEISIKSGSLYVLDPPDALIGTSPIRPLVAWEALRLLGNGGCAVQMPKVSGKGRGKGRGKSWTMKFLKSGFSNTLASPPEAFFPHERFVTAKVRLIKHDNLQISIKLTFVGKGGLVISDISQDESRLLTYTERAVHPRFRDGSAMRGDIRINLSVQTPLSPEEQIFQQVAQSPPVSLPPSVAATDREWFLHLRANGAETDYVFEVIRAHHRQSRSMRETDGFVHNTNRVVWLLPTEQGGVHVEADVCEVSAKLDMGLMHGLHSEALLPRIEEAKRQLLLDGD